MKKILFAAAVILSVLSGCSKDGAGSEEGTGRLQLHFGYAGEYSDRTPQLVPASKAGAASDHEFLDTFTVTIEKISGAGSFSLVCTVAEFNEAYADGTIDLPRGEYSVDVTSPSSGNAAWDQPVYGVSDTFVIQENTRTSLDLVCSLVNVKVTVNLSDNFRDELSAYSIIVTGDYQDGSASLTWSSSDTGLENREGYFAVSPLTVEIQGTRGVGESEVHATYKIEDVAAADHYILNIDAEPTGEAGTSITIDYSVNEKPVDIVIPGFDEVPVTDPDDPDTPEDTAPQLIWEANPEFDPTPLSETMEVNLVVKAPARIASFVVDVESATLEPLLTMMVGSSSMDLIGNEQAVTVLGGLGLPVGDQLLGQTEVDFPLSTLLPLLYQLEPEAGSEHTFTLKVADEAGQELVQDLVFYMPE